MSLMPPRRRSVALAATGVATALLVAVSAAPAHADQTEIIDSYIDDVSIYGPVSSACSVNGNTLTYDISVFDSGDSGPLHAVSLVVDNVVVNTVTAERDVRTQLRGTYTPAGNSWTVNVTINRSQGIVNAWGPDKIFTCSTPDPEPTTIAATSPTQTGDVISIPIIDGVTYVNEETGEALSGTITLTGPLTVAARASGQTAVSGGPWTFRPAVTSQPTETPSVSPTPSESAAPGPAPSDTRAPTPTQTSSTRTLAATGADDVSPWMLGGALALIAGGALLLRRRKMVTDRTATTNAATDD